MPSHDAGPPERLVPPDAAATADALVVVPGQGIGPVSLGMDRLAVTHLGLPTGASTGDGRLVRLGALELTYDQAAPLGTVAGVRVHLPESLGGVRLNGTPLAPGATLADVRAAVEPCGPTTASLGASTTTCMDGAVEITQAGPLQSLWVGIHR